MTGPSGAVLNIPGLPLPAAAPGYPVITGQARSDLAACLREAYEAGATVNELRQAVGRSTVFAWKLLQEAGTEMRDEGRARRVLPCGQVGGESGASAVHLNQSDSTRKLVAATFDDEDLRLASPRYSLILALLQNPTQRLGIADLARMTRYHKMTIAKYAKALEDQGFLRRFTDPSRGEGQPSKHFYLLTPPGVKAGRDEIWLVATPALQKAATALGLSIDRAVR